MTITELASLDAAERDRLRAVAIRDTRRQIESSSARGARTDILRAHLLRLTTQNGTVG
jgi:hypothetical protein